MQTLKITQLNIPEILKTALALPKTGYLEASSGYTYLNIDNDYIYKLYEILIHNTQNTEIKKPPYFDKYSMGAHITVIYPEEKILANAEDIGQKHNFKITGIFSAIANVKKYYALKIEAPTLLQLRREYHLPDKLNFKNHWIDFHITFGISDA